MFCIIQTTTSSEENAKELAGLIIRKKLAKCAHITPIQSIYEWKNEIQSEAEWVIQLKSKSTDFEEVEKVLTAQHPYDVPEIITIPITNGSEAYLKWLNS
jgi:periplasmic divalent cation tolerance protein